MTDRLLEVTDLHLGFAGIRALDGVGFSVETGELFAIIGPNGAGKTSIFNCLNGVYRPQEGSIRLQGTELIGKRPHRIAGLGVARTFQNIELFENLTVLENILLGRHLHVRYGTLSAMVWFGRAQRQEDLHRERAEEIIDFLGLRAWQPDGFKMYSSATSKDPARAAEDLPRELQGRLEEFFSPHNAALADILGRDFDWFGSERS